MGYYANYSIINTSTAELCGHVFYNYSDYIEYIYRKFSALYSLYTIKIWQYMNDVSSVIPCQFMTYRVL
jgi:hypothetical protein